MAVIFLRGLFLSLSLSIPLGPGNLAILRAGLRHGWRGAVLTGLGTVAGDLFYFTLSLLGAATLLSRWPTIGTALAAAGALLLVGLGGMTLRDAWRGVAIRWNPEASSSRLFFTGLMITLTNPMVILWFAAIASTMLRLGIPVITPSTVAVFYGGFTAGSLLWVGALGLITHGGLRMLSPAVLRVLTALCGLTLLAMGGWGGFRLIGLLG
ncbi:LysE family transporter [Thermoflexus sp.]|uniref:LysE family translocator n=1 Tax=Thermoflexus sp. TaxID=1969742 RepID=UPI0025E1F25E|nr:LysE family transporter [Thermoflexus sp.]MDW8181099.1 LysE family transporter [Anaerolineae bacterium]MCS6964566.1 LysE family translocator [Thermoflexus sp.]MCS7351641.1 LysE family translocator [Thermoflexus sp.]MCX7691190.1 LysE family translocator [Thermoflexus sp.]MDW8184705.1 LysE family transporter [Anaerolineae bacterium]